VERKGIKAENAPRRGKKEQDVTSANRKDIEHQIVQIMNRVIKIKMVIKNICHLLIKEGGVVIVRVEIKGVGEIPVLQMKEVGEIPVLQMKEVGGIQALQLKLMIMHGVLLQAKVKLKNLHGELLPILLKKIAGEIQVLIR
jgi:hypothetical protein